MYIFLWCVINVIFALFCFFTIFILPNLETPVYINVILTVVLCFLCAYAMPFLIKWYDQYASRDITKYISYGCISLALTIGMIYDIVSSKKDKTGDE